MPDVIVKCDGCGTILDVEDVALDYGDFCLVVSPCTCVLEEYQEREPVDFE